MPRLKLLLAHTLLLLGALLASQGRSEDTSATSATAIASTSWVELRGHRFTVEIAQTDAQRARGLMFRDRMGRNRGMLFIHGMQEPLAYWMKNTRIGLDIFYFDAERRLVSVSKRTPPCDLGDACPPYRSEGPALYVLELNSGEADRLHVKKGDRLTFGPHIPDNPAPAPQP
jgi:uncharacterized membrane protein (UPF0127 family)